MATITFDRNTAQTVGDHQIEKYYDPMASPTDRLMHAMAQARLKCSLDGIEELCESPIEEQVGYALITGFYSGHPDYINIPHPDTLRFLDGEKVTIEDPSIPEQLYRETLMVQDLASDYWLMPNTWITPKIRADFMITNAPTILRKQREGKKTSANQIKSVVIECDSYQYHGEKDKFVKDKARSRAISSQGIPVLHFAGAEIVAKPTEVAIEIIDFVMQHIGGKVRKVVK